jgi:alpha-glucosidase
MELYRDGINADRTARDYKKVQLTINVTNNKTQPLEIHLAPGGGFAAKIVKK